MKSMYMMRQQDTTGVGGDSTNFARVMYHDGVAAWQFEYDFHPTRREFLDNSNSAGPWRPAFRKGRTWGPPYSGPSLFALRSLIPREMDGLLAAQKNLGYSSLVSSAVRLHDQSMAVGQASGATAAIALRHGVPARVIPFDRSKFVELQTAIASSNDHGRPSCLWPYRDLDPVHPAYTAINMLAVQKCLPQLGEETKFRPDAPATRDWIDQVISNTREQIETLVFDEQELLAAKTRGDFASAL